MSIKPQHTWGLWVSMHGMGSILTAVGWAPGLSILDLLRELRSPDWLPSTHPHYEIKWVRGVLLALREVAWHRSCPHCSILSRCKTGNIACSVLSSKPDLNSPLAWESIKTLGTKPAWTWPEPSLQAWLIGYRKLLQLWAKSLPQEPLIPSRMVFHWLETTQLYLFRFT